MVSTSPIPPEAEAFSSTLVWCRACGQAAGAGPGGACGACGADLSPPAFDRHSPVGRTFSFRSRMRSHTGLAVGEGDGVVVLLDRRGLTVEVDTSRLDAVRPDPLARLASPAYRLAVAARSRPEGAAHAGLLLRRSQELLTSTAARRAYAACALEAEDHDGIGEAGLSPLETAWLRLWHHHRNGSPAGVLAQLALLPTGGYPDKLAAVAAGWARLVAGPDGRPLVAAHAEGCTGHPLGALLQAAGGSPEAHWPDGVPVPDAAPGLGFDPAATARLAALVAGDGASGAPAGDDPAGEALRRATDHLFAWEWEKAEAAAFDALGLLDVNGGVAEGGPTAAGAGVAAEALNVAACAVWRAGDPAGAARLLAEADRQLSGPAGAALLVNRSVVAISAGDRSGAAEALGRLVMAGEPVPVRLDAARRALAAWYGGAGTSLAPGTPGRPPDTVVAALRTIGASTSRAQAAECGRADAFDELMSLLHHLGETSALPAAPLPATAPSPWLVLGVPFGTGSTEARLAFTRRARRLRGTDGSAPFTTADLTWALHEIEHRSDDPWHRLDCFRVPLRPPLRRLLRHAALEVITSAVPTRHPDPYAGFDTAGHPSIPEPTPRNPR